MRDRQSMALCIIALWRMFSKLSYDDAVLSSVDDSLGKTACQARKQPRGRLSTWGTGKMLGDGR